MQRNDRKDALNSGREVAAGVILFWFGTMVYGILPLYIGTQAPRLALSPNMAGYIGTAYLCGFVASTASAVWWIPRFGIRKLSAIAGMISLALIGTSGLITDVAVLYPSLFAAGLGSGVIYAIACRIIGSSGDPDRNFGFGTGGQVATVAIVMATATAWAIPSAGMPGLTFLTAIAMLLFLSCVPFLPGRITQSFDEPAAHRHDGSLASILSLLAMLFLFGGGTSIWIFAQQIGVSHGNSLSATGYVLSFALIANAAGCIAASWISRRLGRGPLLIVVQFCLSAFCLLLAYGHAGLPYFAIAIFGWSFFYGFSVVIGMSLIAVVDRSGRAITGAGAVQSLGAAIGPAVGGNIVGGGSFESLGILSASAVIVSLLLGLTALQSHRRHAQDR
ncbi:MFS transporter [Sphingobium sp. WTD-1]|uniref:MFS transporter n=1 Tax=Pseudomonadota TaxID=1224 RepID=UPI0012BB3043|nr:MULTISPECIES: MFS transporter [Pseudomonadota]MCE4542289.1 MFS transporter [Caballeronia sp. PC1]MCE4570190.1 MFS transporter [Caballeronia sp. CLC5]MCE4570454.1 MFS transporter [Caballeronia sp. CLC5]QGP77765.1 MFS transporter [Sphingobium sp. CAP-1]QKR98445.1 MFS transporter [Sphingomonas sp. CL5.1]